LNTFYLTIDITFYSILFLNQLSHARGWKTISGSIDFFMILFMSGALAIPLLIFYHLIPRMLQKQFAICLTCESAKFDMLWEKMMPIKCKKCNVPMKLITIPEDLRINRIKAMKKAILTLIPVSLIVFLFYFNIWFTIAVMIPYFVIVLVQGYKWESTSRRRIIDWAIINFQRAKIEIEELHEAKRLVEQRTEPKPYIINFLIGWYGFLGVYFIYIFTYLFFSVNLFGLSENVLLGFIIGMLVSTILISGAGPYLAKRNLAILKPLVLIRAIFYVFLLIFGSFYLFSTVLFGSTGSAIEILLAFNFFIVSFTSYFEFYFLWEKFVEYKSVPEAIIAKFQKYYLTISLSQSLLALFFLSQLPQFSTLEISVIWLYLVVLLLFGDALYLTSCENLSKYWISFPPEPSSSMPSSEEPLPKRPRVLSENFYKTRIIPLHVIIFIAFIIIILTQVNSHSDFEWYIIFLPILAKTLILAEFYYNLYKRNRKRANCKWMKKVSSGIKKVFLWI